MTEREAIKMLKTILRTVYLGNRKFDESIQMAISALEKQEAIKSCTPPSDDWEHYADRLHDIAYQSGYEQGKKDAEQDRWIPVTERPPEECEEVNITWINTEPAVYYEDIKNKPFTGTGLYCRGRWHWYSAVCKDYLEERGMSPCDEMDDAIKVTAWRPLPEPYTEEES